MHRILYGEDPIECGSNSALHIAAYNGNRNIIEFFLPMMKELINKENGGGYTALHLAAGNGHTECVQVLLNDPHINVNLKNHYKETALIEAAVTASAGAVAVLLQHGADVNAANILGETALFFALNPIKSASEADKIETAEILVKHMCIMEAEDLNINASDLQLMVDNESICDFVEECREELTVMKGEEIGCPCISFFQILSGNVDEVAFYVQDESIRDVFRYKSHLNKFRIYGTVIDQKLQEACKKAELQLGSFAFLKYIAKYVLLIAADLPDICFDQVAQYLSDEDMSNMIEAKPIEVAKKSVTKLN